MAPILIDQLMQDSLPEAWKDGQTTPLALSVAFSTKAGRPIPWTVLSRAIDAGIRARWIELAPGSSVWPCEVAAATTVALRQPTAEGVTSEPVQGFAEKPKGVYASTALVDPAELQDFVEILPDVIKAAAGIQLKMELKISLGDGSPIDPEAISTVNGLLIALNPKFEVKP